MQRHCGQAIGSAQLCFSATWETVNPFDKSVFTSFANSGIFGKWFDKSAFVEFGSVAIFDKWSDKVAMAGGGLSKSSAQKLKKIFID